MHKTILAAAAAAALFAPAVGQSAVAQQIDMNGQPETTLEPQAQPVQGSSQALAGRPVSPELLSTHQIRDIQQALEARGAHAIRVDGQWGPDIEAAVRDFQKSENLLSQNGELDPLTLIALGLDPLSFGMSGASETTGNAARDDTSRERMHDPQEEPGREQLILGDERDR
jgi:peptidoglycan hydrolase-like protein with peptidoglycan-binding domain